MQQALPDAKLSDLSLVGVTDGDGWMRVHMTYDAVFDPVGAAIATKGHIVLYYHSRGSAIVGGVCVVTEGCTSADALVATADQALRRRLNSEDLDHILPESADCSTEPVKVPNTTRETQLRTCAYDQGIQLTFTRLDGPTTVESLIAERTPAR